ncbi:regulator of G-protein signaling 3-like [Fundulus diaphanus]
MGKSCQSCDSYVKVSVTSDLHHSMRMKTRMVRNNKNPAYQQNFSLCVSEPLLLGRLCVSVLRRPPNSRCSQLIGCMSFRTGSLIKSSQPISGWFNLLGKEFGRSKHMRVTSQSNRPINSYLQEVKPRADLRRTPDSAPDTDLIRTGTVADTNRSVSTTAASCGPKVSTQQRVACGPLRSLDSDDGTYSSCVSSVLRGSQRLAVSIIRGKDGFGFTICSDCPVRVQAVDLGGPAHQSGLCQGDSVLQLNGLPVETWKCADLAQAIRSCTSQIVLVVWRGLPQLGSTCETLLRPQVNTMITTNKLLSQPVHSKYNHSWGQGRGLRSGLGVLGSLWRDRREDQEEMEDKEMCSSVKGTRVTSSNGENYIILSPINPGGQLPQPVYYNRNGTIGRLYQTHPSRGQNLLHNTPTGMSQETIASHSSTLPVSQPRTTVPGPPGNHGNYQNCTIVQSHLPRSRYGNCASLPPKTLIFPIFVQPLDLCSPDRILQMSEEMILHQADLLPSKVTVLIYSDLLLITREEEAGRCNVLQSPLYLNTLQLREVPSEPLYIYFLQNSGSCWRYLFSLEAFSIEQKVRVSLCLQDNKQPHLVTMETQLPSQFSDLPSDFGLLALNQSDILCRPPSPYSSLSDPRRPPSPSPYSHRTTLSSVVPPPPFTSIFPISSSSPPLRMVPAPPQYISPPPSSSSTLRSPVWKQRDDTEEEKVKRRQEEERQQGEGESSSETSESVGGLVPRGLLLSPHPFNMNDEEEEESTEEEDEEEFSRRPAALRRSLSEGSLLKEPRSPRFLSDSTIHRLTRTSTFALSLALGPPPCPPSPETLREQLTKEGMSLHHMLLLLNGSKGGKSRSCKVKKKKAKSLAADLQSRLAFLRKRKSPSGIHGNSLEKALRNNRPSEWEVQRWAESLDALLSNQYGVAVFRHFLRSEFSEENLDFWLAAEKFKRIKPFSKMAAQAKKIYNEFISTSAVRQVNVDSFVRDSTNHSLNFDVNPTSFQLAQDQIFSLMETDSYPRFLKSRLYAQLANHNTATALEVSNQSRSAS